jgi:hypothetical protein
MLRARYSSINFSIARQSPVRKVWPTFAPVSGCLAQRLCLPAEGRACFRTEQHRSTALNWRDFLCPRVIDMLNSSSLSPNSAPARARCFQQCRAIAGAAIFWRRTISDRARPKGRCGSELRAPEVWPFPRRRGSYAGRRARLSSRGAVFLCRGELSRLRPTVERGDGIDDASGRPPVEWRPAISDPHLRQRRRGDPQRLAASGVCRYNVSLINLCPPISKVVP